MAMQVRGVELKRPQTLTHGKSELIVSLELITPRMAASWLKANKNNRPVRSRHVRFLAEQLKKSEWKLTGETIIIAEDETILNGQHRLYAIIDSDTPMLCLVVYGVDKEAFTAMDTGIVRTGADVLSIYYPEMPVDARKAVATGARYAQLITAAFAHEKSKFSNDDLVRYVDENPQLWRYYEIISGAGPKAMRPVPLSGLIGLLRALEGKAPHDTARDFVCNIASGVGLGSSDVEYVYRAHVMRNLQTRDRWSPQLRLKMAVKAWNYIARPAKLRRGKSGGPSFQGHIRVHSTDTARSLTLIKLPAGGAK